MATKTIRLIKPWYMHPKDEVISPDEPVADLLIQSGRAVLVEEKKEKAPPAPSKASKKN